MAAAVPVSGSGYAYLVATVGEFVAWLLGWALIMEYLMGSATVAASWSGYLASALESSGVRLNRKFFSAPFALDKDEIAGYMNLPGFALVLLIMCMLCFGVKQSAWLNHMVRVFLGNPLWLDFVLSFMDALKMTTWTTNRAWFDDKLTTSLRIFTSLSRLNFR
jgi:APA family basic amino acid/polyamine antiporter